MAVKSGVAIKGKGRPLAVAGKQVVRKRRADMKISLIVAAGGSSTRFFKSSPNAAHSKLFFPLQGKPILARSLDSFQKVSEITETVIAAPKGLELPIRQMTQGMRGNIRLVRGGKTRAESVWNALQKTSPKNNWVMVHDGARPFIKAETLQHLLKGAQGVDGIILAKKVVPTIKQVNVRGHVQRTVDRASLYEAETPQLVRREVLKKAYRDNELAFEATDEASLLESIDASVKVYSHEDWNPKLTHFHDLELADAYLNRLNPPVVRSGFGRDTHRLVEKRKMILGGVTIPFSKGPLGHSDGDALLHAICDAILGATGQGDIGEWFSDQDSKFKNMASTKMLQKIVDDLSQDQWKVEHVDTVVILERPKLVSYKTKIRNKISKILKIPSDCVSIKAKTLEGLGPEGEGKAVTCEAFVTVRKSYS